MNGHLNDEVLHRYLDQDLSWDERQRVREHVLTCAECRQRLEHLRQAEHALRQMTAFSVPADFADQVMQQVHQAAPLPWTWMSIPWVGRAFLGVGVFLLIGAAWEAWSLDNAFSTWMNGTSQWDRVVQTFFNDPVSAFYVLLSAGSGTESGVSQTVVPLALAFIALGGFLHLVRWITTSAGHFSQPAYTASLRDLY